MEKILIADDEELMRQLVADFLRPEGYEVLEAADGKQALEIFNDQKPDLVLLDVMMPGYDGWTVCREIRRTSTVPIVMITAKDEEIDQLFAYDLGVDDYITKPFSPKLLVAKMKVLLRRLHGEHIRFFSLVSRISDHTYVTISQPLAPLQENVKIVQRFIVVFGCVWMALALWGALKASQRLTEPLYELKEIAMDMAQLNFSRKWSRTGMSDEINMVGESLNTLSDKLNTALEALQQSNTALQEQLDKANEIEYMRKSFISAVSHELKTPLAIIQGYAEALENLQNVSAETREYYCFVIRSETRKMDGLVKDILNLSRLEAGRLHLELTNFDFVALIEETKIRFQAPAEEKKIRIVWNMLAEMPAYGDPGRYDIILNNFLSNAVDYTPVNGTIRITAKAEEDDYLIEVFNEGKQIPEEYHQRIWEPFYKVDSSHTRDAKRMFGGHGLGLGIVSSLLTLHGQKYGVRNEKDGVTLWFTVARAK